MVRTAEKGRRSTQRIDRLLVDRGLAESRTKAQALVMAGLVLADEIRIEKPSQMVSVSASIRLKGESEEAKYASRAGLKLEHALQHFGVDPAGWICIDIGSSTGGFTDCLLAHGASKIAAIDSGTNQMIWRLRNDSRVDLRENTNARTLSPAHFAEKFDLATIDVSFISVTKLLPVVVRLLKERGKIIVLIKPQFEVGKGEVGKGGIVREPEKHRLVVRDVDAAAEELELSVVGVTKSPILGAKGNAEFLALYER
jgi:23S rRNA (cytidine1920-2'-O)/16S rRNA (cytidine1409-2'-O)-methyltransferase